MSRSSRRLAGVLLVLFPSVVYGGVTVLRLLIDRSPGHVDNPLRQDLWRTGHAHAGVLLVLSLVVLRYVDEAVLPDWLKAVVRHTTPAAAVLLPTAYFLSVASPDATEPNGLIALAFVGAAVLALGLLVLGIGLLRRPGAPGRNRPVPRPSARAPPAAVPPVGGRRDAVRVPP